MDENCKGDRDAEQWLASTVDSGIPDTAKQMRRAMQHLEAELITFVTIYLQVCKLTWLLSTDNQVSETLARQLS